MSPVRVLSVASEIYPIIKTGGLADVAGALPVALKAEGIEMRTLVPGYPAVIDALEAAETLLEWPLLQRSAACARYRFVFSAFVCSGNDRHRFRRRRV